jgi:hypothetical protein
MERLRFEVNLTPFEQLSSAPKTACLPLYRLSFIASPVNLYSHLKNVFLFHAPTTPIECNLAVVTVNSRT